MSLTRSLVAKLADLGLSSVGQFVLLGFIVRRLGPTELSSWQALFQIFCLIQIAELGQGQGIVKELSQSTTESAWSETWHSAARVQWIVGAIACLIGLAASTQLQRWIPVAEPQACTLGLAGLSLWSLFRFRVLLPAKAGYARGHILYSTLIDAVGSASRPWLAIVAVWITGSFLAIPAGYILGELIAGLSAVVYCPRQLKPRAQFRPVTARMCNIFSFGLANGMVSLSSQAAGYIQPLLIGSMLGLAHLTTYSCGLALTGLLARIGYMPTALLYPRLLAARRAGTFDGWRALTTGYLPVALVLMPIAALAFYWGYEPLTTLWVGHAFVGSQTFRSLLAMVLVTYVVQDYLIMVARVALDSFWHIGIASLAQTCAVLAITIACLHPHGESGALAALFIAQLVMCVYATIMILRRGPSATK